MVLSVEVKHIDQCSIVMMDMSYEAAKGRISEALVMDCLQPQNFEVSLERTSKSIIMANQQKPNRKKGK